MPFRLRHLQHNFELAQGDFIIGRSAECQLALDDPLVSRRHAMLVVTADSVAIKDLGSRNGVMVNGVRIDGPRMLLDGDRVGIGSQEMTIVAWRSSRLDAATFHQGRRRTGVQTLSSIVPVHLQDRPSMGVGDPSKEATKRLESLPLLSGLADKALALGRPEDAERILSTVLNDLLANARAMNPIPPDAIDQAGTYAVRLAGATSKGSWVDYVVALYSAVRRPCPGVLVDELNDIVRKTTPVDLAALRSYVELLREASPSFGPAERFLIQRIEGLERLAALK